MTCTILQPGMRNGFRNSSASVVFLNPPASKGQDAGRNIRRAGGYLHERAANMWIRPHYSRHGKRANADVIHITIETGGFVQTADGPARD